MAVYRDMEHRKRVVVERQAFVSHTCSNDPERHLLRVLPASEMARVAEPLLVCNECGERLVGTEEFVSAIRAGLKILEQNSRVRALCSGVLLENRTSTEKENRS